MNNYKAENVFCKNGNVFETKLIKRKLTAIYDQALNIKLEMNKDL
jgi:hypothetical protein